MPHFFESNSLTNEQKSRWEAAINEYSRVQEMNLDSKLNEMTHQDLLKNMEAFNLDPKSDVTTLRNRLKGFQSIMGGGPAIRNLHCLRACSMAKHLCRFLPPPPIRTLGTPSSRSQARSMY
jgi:hypothetical protein